MGSGFVADKEHVITNAHVVAGTEEVWLEIPKFIEPTTEFDTELIELSKEVIDEYDGYMENMQFSKALESVWKFISRTNKYIDQTTPWILAKDEASKGKLDKVMNYLAESLRIATILISPALTNAPKEIKVQLGLSDDLLTFETTKTFGDRRAHV